VHPSASVGGHLPEEYTSNGQLELKTITSATTV
jgi:hypothetical protein